MYLTYFLITLHQYQMFTITIQDCQPEIISIDQILELITENSQLNLRFQNFGTLFQFNYPPKPSQFNSKTFFYPVNYNLA
jgi:hypothetical protein